MADVWTNPANTVIGDRAYSDDFEQAAELVASAVQGFTDAGVVCCVKHFPGHGDTDTDTHDGAAVVNKSLEELREGEFALHLRHRGGGADMVMVGHITVTALDEVPATISKVLIGEVLRGELGWDGVVITDSLDMGALRAMTTARSACGISRRAETSCWCPGPGGRRQRAGGRSFRRPPERGAHRRERPARPHAENRTRHNNLNPQSTPPALLAVPGGS